MFNNFEVMQYKKRPWGRMWTLLGTRRFWLKFLVVGGHTSLQSHGHRTEWHAGIFKVTPKNRHYVMPGVYIMVTRGNGESRHEWHVGCYKVAPKQKHRLLRGIYIEYVHGPLVDEKDIVRYEDSYGRA